MSLYELGCNLGFRIIVKENVKFIIDVMFIYYVIISKKYIIMFMLFRYMLLKFMGFKNVNLVLIWE